MGDVSIGNFRKDEPAYTLLGREQKQWFKDALRHSTATWKIWAASVGTVAREGRERAEEERWAAKTREGRERRAQGLERRQAGELQALVVGGQGRLFRPGLHPVLGWVFGMGRKKKGLRD